MMHLLVSHEHITAVFSGYLSMAFYIGGTGLMPGHVYACCVARVHGAAEIH
jgi:hypothetical protein